MMDSFREDVANQPSGDAPLAAIHFANQRMLALYAANPGAMRCLFEVDAAVAPFAQMWRDLTKSWNQRIAANIQRQFPEAFRPEENGRAHVCTPATNAHLVCRLLLDKKNHTPQDTPIYPIQHLHTTKLHYITNNILHTFTAD